MTPAPFIPNDRSVVRLPCCLILQTKHQAEKLCFKRLAALSWIHGHRGRWLRPRRRLRVV